ncbi:MAG: Flp pilus assembly protein CpaB [Methylophilaceae bacterium]
MNNTRAIVMLIIALIAGVGAVTMASRWLTQRSAEVNKIAVAAVDITLGQKLTPEMVKMVDWPASSIPPDSFNDTAKLTDRVIKTSLQRGEPVMESKLAPIGTQGGLSAVIAEGKRAITVRVNDVIGVAGFALPGNYVDIIVNTQTENQREDRDQDISKIVLERILVLAVAQELGQDQTKPKVVNAVTLEVSPEQAEAIDLARSVGTLSLVLRNQIDQNFGITEGITKDGLLNMKAPPPEPAVVAVNTPAPAPVKPKVIKRKVASTAPVVVPKNCTKVINGLSETLECF